MEANNGNNKKPTQEDISTMINNYIIVITSIMVHIECKLTTKIQLIHVDFNIFQMMNKDLDGKEGVTGSVAIKWFPKKNKNLQKVQLFLNPFPCI